MYSSRTSMGFSEKRISMNAFFAFVLGILLNTAHIGMVALSIRKQGHVPFAGGVIESYVFLFSIFGLLWSIMSLDEEKTNSKYKTQGIILNGIALIVSVIIMALGIS